MPPPRRSLSGVRRGLCRHDDLRTAIPICGAPHRFAVVDLSDERDPAVLDRIGSAVAADHGIAAVQPALVNADGDTAVLLAQPTTSPQDTETDDTVQRLRADVLPAAIEGTDVEVMVGGRTALMSDLSERITSRLPAFILAVVALSFLLLMLVFRSILVPLKAAIMNLLSIGAAYGVVVAVFQWGWAKGLVGLDSAVPINPFVPMIMFAILFGLSMDYEVFLLSRVREEFLRTGDSHTSVVDGLASTARVITSAALIMISVFLAFVATDDVTVKMFGLGLATAVFIDATLVRMVLVPSTMSLLGSANWWLPRWLDRILPHMDLEGGHFATESEVVTDAEIAELLEGETNEEGDGERQLELV
jgi:RND superfamily putative drug exporter